MQRIQVLIYPYYMEKPVVISMPKTKKSFEEYIGGKISQFYLYDDFVVLISKDTYSSKYNNCLGIYGNIIIAKARNDRFVSLSSSDISKLRKKQTEIRNSLKKKYEEGNRFFQNKEEIC